VSATLDITGQRQLGHLIDGRIVRGERTFPVDAPETGKVVAECPDATPEMVDDAMAAATWHSRVGTRSAKTGDAWSCVACSPRCGNTSTCRRGDPQR
jgi:hypothetical protein